MVSEIELRRVKKGPEVLIAVLSPSQCIFWVTDVVRLIVTDQSVPNIHINEACVMGVDPIMKL